MIYVGIDPGIKGGIATIDDTYSEGDSRRVALYKIEGMTLMDVWITLGRQQNATAILEKVSSSPQMGVVSAFTFGKSAGILEAFLVAAGIPYTLVAPGTWQRTMGCLTKGDKNISKARAQQLFPDLRIIHAWADALLIAEYCRRTHV